MFLLDSSVIFHFLAERFLGFSDKKLSYPRPIDCSALRSCPNPAGSFDAHHAGADRSFWSAGFHEQGASCRPYFAHHD
jgi:hypothetical protein